MYFAIERIKKIDEELKNLIYEKKLKINNYRVKEGNFTSIKEAYGSEGEFKKFGYGDFWGGRDKHCWFSTEVTIPEGYEGETAALLFHTGEEGWDAVNPQFILYVNDELVQGIDVNHREIIIREKAEANEKMKIDLHAYSGMLDKQSKLFGQFITINKEVRELYYNIQVPVLVCEKLEEDDEKRIDMLSVLNATINILDLRKPNSEEFFKSVKAANEYVKEEFYNKMCGKDDVIATCVGHTHIDVAWMWTVEQTKEKAVRSFSTVLKLMEEYPEYIFMSSQPQLYKFVKERNPELYEKIKEKIKKRVWEPEGAMWLEADCNVTSGESLVRQIMYGKRFFKKEFNVENEVLWLPDVFGYSAALPQILKKSEVNYFMTTKISWNEFNKIPYDTFMWKGIDGTEVLTHFITTTDLNPNNKVHFTTYNGQLHPAAIMGGWKRYQQKEINKDILISFGFGDGGGGATKEMLEMGRRMNKGIPGCPKVVMGNSKEYFKRLEAKVKNNKRLPEWVGELYLEYHRGTYTSMGKNKRFNRKCEYLYQDIENLMSFDMLLGGKYYQKELNSAWENILLNQFHDILPGSAIKEVYEVSTEEYTGLISKGKELLNMGFKGLCSKIDLKEKSIVVFNTLSHNRSDIVALDLDKDMKGKYIQDSVGNEIPSQICKESGIEKLLLFVRDVPAKGYKVLNICKEKAGESSNLIINKNKLQNKFYSIDIDDKGTFTSRYDRINKREVLKKGERGNKLQAFEDKPMEFDNWNIDIYYQEKMWEIDDVENIEIIENGPVRGRLRITRRFMDSVIKQDICIYEDTPGIDFDTYVDWKESQILLKAAFPVDIHADKATYDIQYGNVERPTHFNTSWDTARFEVCGHKWADISEDGFGVSLMNDCKYGYDIKDGVMRLTLIKSGIEPNKDADKEEHFFKYSLYPHEGNWKKGNTVQKAYEINVPLIASIEKAHKGSLPEKLSFITLNKDNVILETVKKAEDSDDIVVRMYECYNRRTEVKLTFFNDFIKICECNLLERDINEISFEKNSFSFTIKPYEIKTFKISCANFKK